MTHTLFTQFLAALGVPHTAGYSDRRFNTMTFRSLFGLTHLLSDYGIPSEAWRLADKSQITRLTPPFLARSKNGIFAIVKSIDTADDRICYDYAAQSRTARLDRFTDNFDGTVLLAFPDENSGEPDYRAHAVASFVSGASVYALAVCLAALFAYFFVTRRIYAGIPTILVCLFDMIGLWFSYMLMQKSIGIHTRTSEHVCGVLEHGGCDSIVKLKVSKLFGVFSWSEIGFGYFGVSLAALLIFPGLLPCLALLNACCLPYTVWSIWYQRFRARHWCTLCVGVQATQWLLFGSYLLAGAWKSVLPIRIELFVLLAAYIAAVLAINITVRIFRNHPEENEENTAS